jgi:methylenetetrahydrofolate--tRNA-(uracil-5-)-methyltransferase
VEGYIESAASGLVAGINAARLAQGKAPLIFPPETCHGALCRYITEAEAQNFQPMNISFGLLPPLNEKIRDKKMKKQRLSERALNILEQFYKEHDEWR